MRNLNSPWALVTGASRGIGLKMAEVAVRRGYNILAISRDPERLKRTCEYLASLRKGATIEGFPLDLSERGEGWVRLEEWLKGFSPISLLINNAGVYATGDLVAFDPREGERMIRINLISAMEITRLVLPGMIARREGTVIFVASQAGRIGFAGATYYCASKFGILGFASALFEEVRGLGIKVVSLLPGYVNTDMVEGIPGLRRERMIPPEDLALTLEYILDLHPQSVPSEIHLRTLLPADEPLS